MATNALHAIVIKAFRDRLVSLGIDPIKVIETASRGRGATASAQSPLYCARSTRISRDYVRRHDTSHKNRQWPGSW